MASATALEDSDEKCNGTKLARLLIDGGTEALRRTFDSIHSPANLQAELHTNKPLLKQLRTEKRVLNSGQWDKLYPPGGAAPDSKTFDITLLFVLLRNICDLKPPTTGWDALPPAGDVSREANLARIKYYRNQVYGHVTSTEVSEADFEQYWGDISGALIALGADQVSIDLLKSSDIADTTILNVLEKWKTEEESLKDMIPGIYRKIHRVETKLDEVLKEPPLLKRLSNCNFNGESNRLVNQYHKETRLGVLNKIEDFRTNSKAKWLVIMGPPGVGKSVIAAVASKNLREKGHLGDCYFIQHNNTKRSNPRVVIESIASHLCESVKGFKEKLNARLYQMQPDLRKSLNKMSLEDLITELIEEPLAKVEDHPDEKLLVIIDALDECEANARETLFDVLQHKTQCMPEWIKFVVTTRSTKLFRKLPHVSVIHIEPLGENNIEDIQLYLSHQLRFKYPNEPQELLKNVVSNIIKKSGGIFLYAYFTIESIEDEKLSEASEFFPNGISDIYERYITRSKKELQDLNIDEENFMNFLKAIVSAQDPLPESLVLQILGVKQNSRQEKENARLVLKSLSLLFPVDRKLVTVFHKSFSDWLTKGEDGYEEHLFQVEVKAGNCVLAHQCVEILRNVENYKKYHNELSSSESYPLTFGFFHMLKAGGYEEQLNECVMLSPISFSWQKKFVSNGTELSNELERIYEICKHKEDSEEMKQYLANKHCLYFKDFESFPLLGLQCAAYCPEQSSFYTQALAVLKSSQHRNYVWIEMNGKEIELPTVHLKKCPWENHKWSRIEVSQRGDVIAVLYGNLPYKCLCLIDVATGNVLSTSEWNGQDGVQDVCFFPDSLRVLVTTTEEVQIRFIREKECIAAGTQPPQPPQPPRPARPVRSCIVDDGSQKIVAGYKNGNIRVWDTENQSQNCVEITECHKERVALCISHSGHLVTGDIDRKLLLWQSTNDTSPVQLTDEWQCNHVCFSSDGSRLAALCGRQILPLVMLFDTGTAEMLEVVSTPVPFSGSICLIDNCNLLGGEAQLMYVLNTTTGEHQYLAPKNTERDHVAIPGRPGEFFAIHDNHVAPGATAKGGQKIVKYKLNNVH